MAARLYYSLPQPGLYLGSQRTRQPLLTLGNYQAMSHRRNQIPGPCRITDLFMQTTSKHEQDGTREKGHSPLLPYTEPLPPTDSDDLSDMGDSSQQHDNPTASDRGKRAVESPAHSPQKLPSAKKHHWEDIPESAADTPAEHTAPPAAFPA